jgi:hypothetical protein
MNTPSATLHQPLQKMNEQQFREFCGEWAISWLTPSAKQVTTVYLNNIPVAAEEFAAAFIRIIKPEAVVVIRRCVVKIDAPGENPGYAFHIVLNNGRTSHTDTCMTPDAANAFLRGIKAILSIEGKLLSNLPPL